ACRLQRAAFELAADLRGSGLLDRLHMQQRIDEEAVSLVGRNATCRSMGRGDEAQLLEVGHYVADGRRGELQAGLTRERARPHGLAVADVAFDEYPQQVLRPLGELLFCTHALLMRCARGINRVRRKRVRGL